MSKMGITTIASYTRRASFLKLIGTFAAVVDEYFCGTTSRLGEVSLNVIAQEVIARHHIAYPPGGKFQALNACLLVANTNGAAKANHISLIRNRLHVAALHANETLRCLEALHQPC